MNMDPTALNPPAWLAAVEAAARKAALVNDRKRVSWHVDDERMPAFAYRWEHIQQVVRNGRWLLAGLSADDDVVLAGCWLHDVKKGGPNHAQRGADFAREFLPTIDFPPHKVEAVAQAIAQHEGLWRADPTWERNPNAPFRAAPPLEPIEVAILWDADKLSKVGPVGFIHFFGAHLYELEQHGETTTTQTLLTGNRHWLETIAPRTLASFNTAAAQQRAMQFHATYELFWQAAEDAAGTRTLEAAETPRQVT